MYSLLIFFIIGIVGGAYFCYKHYKWDGEIISDFFCSFFLTGFCGFISLFVWAMFICAVSELIPKSKMDIKESPICNIYNLADNSNVSGHFTLGCGSVNEKMVYTYYVKTNEGFQPSNVETKSTSIREDNSRKPMLVERKYVFKNKNMSNWFFEPIPDIQYVIYVPVGTVTTKYNLDANY